MNVAFFVFGFIVAVVLVMWRSFKWVKAKASKGEYASVIYDPVKKEYRVTGQYAGLAQKLADIRAGRQPGAIKYVD
ncbi:hypothetical protein BI040_gp86 [Escherichia phage vB_EcoS_NBD2]|uniref:Uncharacterized protein n=1 Tax=Escherichia phage vB_EcoS_NBD2 TaxID=1852563 RepID=A0A192Y8B9_9CAUD|nr:hypothetical protein BI040_gp86 [Escherichia phage vB_EcoS_NBD2]ANM45868.1 hypothetical protein NBD2_26 [Escherichia phage vB_EcoS_NBD2]